ncbi:MAG: nucleotide sugar dehydrogenase [Nitrospiraceae bacterium]
MNGLTIGYAGMTHLGINSAVAAAERGVDVIAFDPNAEVIRNLQEGKLPVAEPGLPEMMNKNRPRVTFTASVQDLERCQVVYISADVPTDHQGHSDLLDIHSLIRSVSPMLQSHAVLVVLCQVPPGFTRAVHFPKSRLFYQVETLIFGRAVERALHPERFIIGSVEPAATLPESYRDFLSVFQCPVFSMRYESAELAKIAINCCLVASVTVANTLAELSERIGADWSEIVPALKSDKRIGQHAYLSPGLGLAGGNLERYRATVLQLAEATGSEAGLITSCVTNSRHRRGWVFRTLHREVLAENPKAVIGILGLAYKESTHSTKNSPSVALLKQLSLWQVRVHDPVVKATTVNHPQMVECATPREAARGADALMIMTPWPVYRDLNGRAVADVMAGRTIIDPYRVLNGEEVTACGLDYFTLGAPALRASGQRGASA